MGDGLDGGEGTVATRPERRPRNQDRRGAARCCPVFPFGIGTKAVNRDPGITSSLPFISAPRFLHFTLNHYRSVTPKSSDSTATDRTIQDRASAHFYDNLVNFAALRPPV